MIIKQFQLKQSGSLNKQWLALEQEETVKDYRRKFIELSTLLE